MQLRLAVGVTTLLFTLGCGSGSADTPPNSGGAGQSTGGGGAGFLPATGGAAVAGSAAGGVAALGGQTSLAGSAADKAGAGGVPSAGNGGTGGSAGGLGSTRNVFSVDGAKLTFNGKPFKVIGLRLSNGLISDDKTQELIDNLDTFKAYGVNTVSVFFMGSRFGDVKGYLADASLDPSYAARMARIIEAADSRGMIVLVGCLYWSTSTAKAALGAWKQADANKAVENTVRWLSDNNHRNVFVDVDNEGMANAATGWSIAQLIDAAHAVDPSIMVGYNDTAAPPANADLYMHFSPKVAGKPWIQSEGDGGNGYWGSYSKQSHEADSAFYNYSRIGRYTPSMKQKQIADAERDIANHNGYMMASTWLQCSDDEGVAGPFMTPGGHSNITDVDQDIAVLHPDAGVKWWLEAMQAKYGAWEAPLVQ